MRVAFRPHFAISISVFLLKMETISDVLNGNTGENKEEILDFRIRHNHNNLHLCNALARRFSGNLVVKKGITKINIVY